ncbi:MAG TPA: DUF1697 domain-containing protein [Alphaproteobacteria bacterium]|nr:DUF1697 domain-containing protein [Alphaproteobacteria bacterium]
MTVYVALLRAINIGGTGVLPMNDLRALCAEIGFRHVRTYIQSGNVVFESPASEREVRTALERALAEWMGKPVDVMIRTAAELRSVLVANPFPDVKPAQVAVVFLADPAPQDLLAGLVVPGREEIRPAGREVYIHYPDGMGRSKLKLPAAARGTARNINTVAKLVEMAER